MNNDLYPQVHTTTAALGSDQTPTPVKVCISKTGEDYSISAEGADGQQVVDLTVSAMSRMPNNKKTASGFLEFTVGLLFFSFLSVAIVNLFFLANPQPRPQAELQNRGSGRVDP